MTKEKRFYGILGEDYDLFKLAVPHHDELQDALGESVRQFCKNNIDLETVTVLEIGCGHGATTRRILNADPCVHVIAVDNDPKMLATAQENLRSYGSRVQFDDNLFGALKGPGSGPWIDVVASAYTLHNFHRGYRETVVQTILRKLKKPGLYVNADKYAQKDIVAHWEDLKKQIDAFEVFDDIGRHDLRDEWTKHYLEDEQTRWTAEEDRALFSKAGFHRADILYERKGMEALFCARWG